MSVLILGASGATGKLLLSFLVLQNIKVKIILRKGAFLEDDFIKHENVEIIRTNVYDLSKEDISLLLSDVKSVFSCLGHTLSIKGMYFDPKNLVCEITKRFCEVIQEQKEKNIRKFILMNTAGNSNRDLNEKISFAQKCIMSVLRNLIPPHKDNENASDYLRKIIGQNNEYLQWCIIRPDALINEIKQSEYELYASPIRSAIFNSGSTSRINVAHLMSTLHINSDTWDKWQGQMPVVYNKTSSL